MNEIGTITLILSLISLIFAILIKPTTNKKYSH